ncbi:MAG TPA: energy transducer TonB [Blastocatellia bacterium]
MKISLMSLFLCLSISIQQESFEKRAISAAQRIPASSLDEKLPKRSFGGWLNEVVGQEAGVVWQLAECGAVNSTDGNGQDVSACAEATVLLPNGDKMILGISVGTFKKGLIGEPSFRGAVIDSGERLFKIRRLSDLPGTLRPSKGVPLLPNLQADTLQAPALLPVPGENDFTPGFSALDKEIEAPPPPSSKKNSGDLVGASVISRVNPAYPTAARAMRASGNVEVRVVISETGRVVDAIALSGPMTLRGAAIAAARQWIYKPATRNGAPVKTESVITFTFNPDK